VEVGGGGWGLAGGRAGEVRGGGRFGARERVGLELRAGGVAAVDGSVGSGV
jgi:hypothetical protein